MGSRKIPSPWNLAVLVVLLSAFFAWLLTLDLASSVTRDGVIRWLGATASLATVFVVFATAVFVTDDLRRAAALNDQLQDILEALPKEQAFGDGPQSGAGEGSTDRSAAVFTSEGDRDGVSRVEVDGKVLRYHTLAEVPLQVWAELVNMWRVDEKAGRWKGSDVAWVLRAEGRGNPPWLVRFTPDPGHIYRIAYGGRGKLVGTVRRYRLPDYLQAFDDSFK
jgi:hypothetical protein